MLIHLILTFPITRIADQDAGVWICSSRGSQYGELVSTTPPNNVFLSLWSMNPIILLCTSGHSRIAKRGWFRLQRHLTLVQSPYNIKPKINIRSSIVWKKIHLLLYVIRSRSCLPFECTWVLPRLFYGLRVAHVFCFLCCVVCCSVLFVFIVFLVCPMLPVSLDCPFLFRLVFSNDSIRWIYKNKWFMSFFFINLMKITCTLYDPRNKHMV